MPFTEFKARPFGKPDGFGVIANSSRRHIYQPVLYCKQYHPRYIK